MKKAYRNTTFNHRPDGIFYTIYNPGSRHYLKFTDFVRLSSFFCPVRGGSFAGNPEENPVKCAEAFKS